MIIRLDTIECSYNNYEVILLEGDLFPLMFCEVVMKIIGGHNYRGTWRSYYIMKILGRYIGEPISFDVV